MTLQCTESDGLFLGHEVSLEGSYCFPEKKEEEIHIVLCNVFYNMN